jgi:hypothetical protein
VSGQQHLRAQRRHLAKRDRPLGGVPLHLLRVAGVGRGPDEQVTAAEHLAVGEPRPGVVVGLAARCMQLDALTDIE